ncbi:hypothetical protein PIB30_071544 [Stylosanthes scabra]|uniref:Replication factor A C-terminal domain-containing protein n=1 Tax=Stylosanthes scabra TaxID=79078 RepID=A0ABU6XPH2_9FABA|nr:hypothetical protein [Stylosanthes scabra]
MKCTVFGDLVGKVVQLAEREDAQPSILVAQLFKPCVYLSEQVDVASQAISHVESQPDYLIGDELEGGAHRINSIEEVLNFTHETSCWILAHIVSVEAGANGWGYASCIKCPNKVKELKNGYQCDICKTKAQGGKSLPKALKSILEKKFLFKLSVSNQNINCIDQLYSVQKIRDDETLIGFMDRKLLWTLE